MNQTCRVCGEPAAGFHFGAFTCEGCKSFFGRSYNNLNTNQCKNNNKCIIDKKNRTTCKSCRLRKCLLVGMSKGSSRYGRRSNWFKIHCLLQEHQQQALEVANKSFIIGKSLSQTEQQHQVDFEQHQHLHQEQHKHQQLNNVAAMQLSAANSFLSAYPGFHAHHLPTNGATASPFMSAAAFATAVTHKPYAAEAAAFFSAVNTPQPVFQLPSCLLLSMAAPGYRQKTAAATDEPLRSSEKESYPNSVDSATPCNSPPPDSLCAIVRTHCLQPSAASSPNRQSPELSLSGDHEELQSESKNFPLRPSTYPEQTTTPNMAEKPKPLDFIPFNQRHSPTSKNSINENVKTKLGFNPVSLEASSLVPKPKPTPTSGSVPRTPERKTAESDVLFYSQRSSQHINLLQRDHELQQLQSTHQLESQSHSQRSSEKTALTFAAKIQSLSPVSVCSISAELALGGSFPNITYQQDSPIDLSVKAIPAHTDCDNIEMLQEYSVRRKIDQLRSESEGNSLSSSSLSTSSTYKSLFPAATSPTLPFLQIIENNGNNINETNIKIRISSSNVTAAKALINVEEHVKRQKLSSAVEVTAVAGTTAKTVAEAAASNARYNNFETTNHGATSLHGFFVCV